MYIQLFRKPPVTWSGHSLFILPPEMYEDYDLFWYLTLSIFCSLAITVSVYFQVCIEFAFPRWQIMSTLFFICVLGICISSLCKKCKQKYVSCLFRSFVHFWLHCLSYYDVVGVLHIFWVEAFCQIYLWISSCNMQLVYFFSGVLEAQFL